PYTTAPSRTSTEHTAGPRNPEAPVTSIFFPAIELIAWSPDSPRCLVVVPQFLHVQKFAIRVDTLPESLVLVCGQLTVGGQLMQRILLERDILIWQPVEHFSVEYKEAAAYPGAGDKWFFRE